MNNSHKSVNMLSGPLYKNILMFSLPIAASGFLQLLFNAADLVVVGRWCGSGSLAAVGATSSISMLIVNLFMGFSIGAGVQVSTGLGAKDDVKVHNAVHTSIPFAFICGLFIAVLGFFISRPMLEYMSTPDDIIDLSTLYLRIYFCGMPASLVYNYGAAILRASGDSARPLKYLSISGILNVLLNIIFVTQLDMNVAGVALATALTTVLSAVLTLRALSRRTDACRLDFRKMRFNKESLLAIARIGLPAGIQNSMFSVSNMIVQGFINEFGTVVIAGNSAAQSLLGFAFTFLDSFSQASVNFTGQNFGARQYDRIFKVRNCCYVYEFIFGMIIPGILLLFSESLLSIYVPDDPEAVGIGVIRLTIVGLTTFMNAMLNTTSGVMRGIGYSAIPMVISVVGICGIRLLFVYTVFAQPRFHTLQVLYMANPLSWIISFLIATAVLKVLAKKTLTPLEYETTGGI